MTELPMTVLGGYLGAGKTTLLNKLLAEARGRRIAVVVNDFGAVNVDADLLRSRDEDTIELSNGCICCSLTDGMAQVMDRLRGLRDRLDHVVVEVSGVGDPGAVAAWAGHPGFHRNLVLVCADVLTVRQHATDRWVADTVLAQLRSADAVLLTKADLAEAELTAQVRSWVTDVSPGLPILEGPVDAADLLDGGHHPRPGSAPDRARAHPEAHDSWSLTGHDIVPSETLSELLERVPPDVVRLKGVLRTSAAPDRRTVVQVAGGEVEVRDDGPWADTEKPSTLVVIARPGAGPRGAADYLGELERGLRLARDRV